MKTCCDPIRPRVRSGLLLWLLGWALGWQLQAAETAAPGAANPASSNAPPAAVEAPSTNTTPTAAEDADVPPSDASPVTDTNAPPAAVEVPETPVAPPEAVSGSASTNAPTTTTVTNAPVAGEIRFDFNDMPLGDVVQRFAQITGKPLIADVQLEGALTFSDPKPYTYGEALDTLNLILAGKQAMLVETGRYLRLIPFDDLQKLPLPIYRGLEETGDVRSGELVTVVLELKNLDAGEISESLKSMLTKAGSVAPLSRGRGLIITDRLSNIRRVRELLAQIDAGAPKQRQMKIHPLKNVSGTLMADLVNRTFGVATAPKRTVFNQSRKTWDVLPPNPDDYVTAIFAAASNTLVMFGPAERMAMAEELINRFETESGARASEVKVYYPQMKAEELARMVQEAIPNIAGSGRDSRRPSRDSGKAAGPQARVIPDPSSNRLIVTAPASGQLEAIEKLIHKLDPTTQEVPPEEQAQKKRELRIVQLQTVSANELAPILRDAFAEQMRNEKGAEFTSRARILPDPTGGKLLLTGLPEELDRITKLIEQLDASEASRGEIRVFKLKVARASAVAAMIMGAMGGDVRGRYDFRRHGGLQRPGGLPARAVGDDRSNTVFVMASREQMKLIEELIQGIETEGPTAGRQLRLVTLEKGSATAVVAMLSQLFVAQIRNSDPARRIAMTAAPDDRTIAFEADTETLDRLEKTTRQLDVAPAETDHEIRTYAVPEGRVMEIVSTLSRLFGAERERYGRRETGGFTPRFEGDATSDTLIVAARSEDFARIEELLKKLRTAVSEATQLRTFHLEHAQAEQVVQVLRDMLGGGGGGDSRSWYYYMRYRGGGGGASANEFKITAAPALNAVVMRAAPQKLALATQIIQTLDLPESSASAGIRTVVLQKADANAVATAINEMLQPRDRRGQAPAVRVTPVSAAKSILLSGPKEEVDRVEQLITDLDRNSGVAGQETKVYQLAYADAKEVVQVLQSTLGGMGGGPSSYYYYYRYRGGAGGEEQPKITAASGLNAVVVQAPAEKQKQAAELIKQLDVPEAGGAAVVRTVKLQKADPDALVSAVNQVLSSSYGPYRPDQSQGVRVSALAAAKSVLVRGTSKEVERVVALITELDENSGEVGQETTVYQLKYAEAQAVVQVLEATLGGGGGGRDRSYYYYYRYRGGSGGGQEPRVTEAKGLNAVIVQANKEQQQRAADLIRQIDVPEAAGATVVRTVKLKKADADAVVNAITQILYTPYGRGEPPKVRVSALSAAKSILVQGSGNEVERMVKLIAELDENSGEVGQQTKVYHLAHADAREVVQVLQATLTGGAGGRNYYYYYRYGRGGGGNQAQVTAATALNAVVVQANAEQQEQAAALIQQLDVPEAAGAGQVQTVRLEKADADAVALAVNDALRGQGRDGQPPAVKVTPVQIARSLLVSGPTNEVAQVIELVHGLDETSGDASLEMKVYPLQHAEAQEVVDVLQSALGSGSSGPVPYWMRGRYGNPQQQQDFKVTAASGLNAVVVQATPARQEQAAKLIETLDVEQSGQAGLVRAIQLEKADPNSVATAVNNALAPRDFRSGPPPVRVTAVSGTRTILVNGPPAEIDKVVELVHGLDETGGDAGLETHVYQLQYATAAKIAEVLRSTLGGSSTSYRSPYSYYYSRYGRSRSGGGSDEFKVTPAEGLNALVVQATTVKQVAVADLIRQLDVPAAAGSAQIRTVLLQKADANAVAEAVNQTLAGKDPRSEPPAVRVVAVMGTRSVLVNGPGSELDRVVQLIQDLDRTSTGTGVETRIYQLKNGDATDLSRTLERLLSGLARSQPRWEGRYGSRSSFTVSPDERTNALIVSGNTDAFAVVEQVLPILDQLPERLDRMVQFFWLISADAFDVQTTLEALFADRSQKDQPVIEADVFSNSLTVVANPADLVMIEDIINQLDVGAEESTQQVRLVTLGSVPAKDMVNMLTNIFPQMSSTPLRILKRLPTPTYVPETISTTNALPAGSTNTSPVSPVRPSTGASSEEGVGANVTSSVRTSASPTTGATNAHSSEGAMASGVAAAAGDTKVAEEPPPVFLSYDPAANALIMSGSPIELDQIQDIIDSLTGSFDEAETEIRQFKLEEADPVAVAKVLSELFKVPQPPQQNKGATAPRTENGRPAQDRGDRGKEKGEKSGQNGKGVPPRPSNPQAQKGGQPPQLPRVAVVAEPRTRSVIVRASAADMALLQSVIEQLDAPGVSSQLEHRSVALEYAQPAKLLPLVEQMIKQISKVQPGDPVAAGADERRRAIFLVGRAKVLDRLEAMIHELDAPSGFAELELRVFPLENATAAALADLLRDMLTPTGGVGRQMSDEARALLEQVQRLRLTNEMGVPMTLDLTKPVKIVADPPRSTTGTGVAQRLIIGATPGNLDAVGGIVKLLDTVPIVEGLTARIVRLKYVDAAVVLDTLNSIFQQGGDGGRKPSPGKSRNGKPKPPKPSARGGALANAPNVALDARNNALILSGLPESIKLAEAIITDLDRELDAVVTEVRLFPLEHAIPSQLVTPLRAVFTEGGKSGAGARGLREQVSRLRLVMGGAVAQLSETATARAAVTIQADDASRTLIVAARSDLMPLLAEVIKTLDVPPVGSFDTLRVFALDHADAASVLQVLTDLARNRSRGRVRTEDLPTISMDERTNAIIASGSDAALAFLEKLVSELDRELPEDLQNVKLIPLENADAGTVATSLQRLMDERSGLRGRGGRGGRGGASAGGFNPQRVVIIPDLRSNTLLVSGAPEGFTLVQSLAKQLDEAGPSLTGQVRLIPLEHATAQTLASMLTQLFNQRYQAMRTPELRRNRPVILADVRSNSLLVAASVEDNQALDELLTKLDREPENPALELAIIGLKVNDAGQVAATLRSVFAARLQALTVPGQRPMPTEQVDVQADSLSNSLIVNASPENLAVVRDLVAKLDVEPVAAGGVIQTFTLQHADVQRVATMLRSLIDQGVYRPGVTRSVPSRGGRGGRGGEASRDALAVTADAGSNTLIVSASPENLVVVKELIRQLDTPEFTEVSDIRTFQLKHARASYLATVLQQFFRAKRQGEATGGGATERSIPVTVTADDRSNTLLITGGKESFAAVERMIQQLDTEEAVSRTNFRVFALKQATAAKLAANLQRLFTGRPTRNGIAPEPVTVIPDTWANALIIGASDDDMAMIENLVEQLDSPTAETGLQVQVFPLAKGDARRVATTLQSMFRGGGAGTGGAAATVTVNVDERLNAVIVSAGAADLKRVAELVKQLDTDQVARVSEIRVMPLENAQASSLATLLNDVLNTNPRQLGDENPNRQSLLQFITRHEGGQELVTSALKEGVLIVPDTRINALVVSAPIDYVKLLEEVIHYLDQSAPQIAKIKVFTLQNADARQMALVLTSLFRLQEAGPAEANDRSVQYTLVRPTENGGEETSVGAIVNSAQEHALTVTVDPRTNSLLVGGTEHYVALASEIIQTLDASPAQERQTEVYRLRNTRAQDVEVPLRTFLQQDLQQMTTILGPNALGTAQNLLEREVGIVAETNSNTLLISASPRYFAQVRALIEQLDQPQAQVLIQVLLAEVNLDQSTELGVEWDYAGTGDPAFSTGTDYALRETFNAFGGYYAALSGSDVQVLLRALRVDGRLEILSRPQILTADNKEATINIGQRVPLVTGSSVTPQGGTVNQFNYEDVGVILTVTPRISPDGFVRMDVGPTISSVSSSSVNISPGLEVPIINQRTATTTVTVQSGQSVMIGGLIGSTEDTRTKKVPFLGSIPVLGALFRSRNESTGRNELLIILTPQILSKGNGVGTTMDSVEYSNHEILNSDLLHQPERDPIQQRILRELHPEGFREGPTNELRRLEKPQARPYTPTEQTVPTSAAPTTPPAVQR